MLIWSLNFGMRVDFYPTAVVHLWRSEHPLNLPKVVEISLHWKVLQYVRLVVKFTYYQGAQTISQIAPNIVKFIKISAGVTKILANSKHFFKIIQISTLIGNWILKWIRFCNKKNPAAMCGCECFGLILAHNHFIGFLSSLDSHFGNLHTVIFCNLPRFTEGRSLRSSHATSI